MVSCVPGADDLHGMAVTGLDLGIVEQVCKHMPGVLAAAEAEHFLLEALASLARERVLGKDLVPDAAGDRAVE